MRTVKPRRPVSLRSLFTAWGRVLRGYSPLLSIEITRECPLHCPGCYAYTPTHLGGGTTLRQLSDLKGDELVESTLKLVRRHRPLQLSIIGGEPLVRERELSQLLPKLSADRVYTLVVTSGIARIPQIWTELPYIRIAVSVDGLPPEHNQRRSPATYDRILANIRDRRVDISWVITAPMMQRAGYLEEYLRFWTARPEVGRIWASIYTPQRGERSAEMLQPADRRRLIDLLPALKKQYPSLILPEGSVAAFETPPASPEACTFARVSVNYSADLSTRVRPCFFGGEPDCSQCGCAVSNGLHWLHERPLAPGLKVGHLIDASLTIGDISRRTRAWVSRAVFRNDAGTRP